MMKSRKSEFILYACAGCSRAGQAAYKIAIELSENGIAEMSCLAGIASGNPFFRKQLRYKKIVVIDGCPVQCARKVFINNGMAISEYFQLQQYGVRKNDAVSNDRLENILEEISRKLKDKESEKSL